MTKLNAAILEAYEGYHTALDCVKGWKQEAASRKTYCMALINAVRKSNPELGTISAKDLFNRTAEMYEAAHATDEVEQAPAEDQEAEVEQAPAEDQEAEVEQAPAEDQEAEVEQAPAEDQEAEVEQAPAEEEPTAGEDQEAPADA